MKPSKALNQIQPLWVMYSKAHTKTTRTISICIPNHEKAISCGRVNKASNNIILYAKMQITDKMGIDSISRKPAYTHTSFPKEKILENNT